MTRSLALVALLAAALAASTASTAPDNDTGTLKVLSRAFDKCSSDPDMYSCLKMRAVNLLDRALSMDSLPISEYLTIAKDPKVPDSGNSIIHTKADLEASLPRDLGQKSSALDKMITDRLSRYLETRTIQLNMPTDLFDGRSDKGWKGYKGGKGDKGGGVFLVFGAFAAMLLQLALGKIALIAGKALLVGKVALLLAGIIGLKSLLSNNQQSHSSQVIYAEPEHHGGWGRSLKGDDSEDAQELVYRAHRPTPGSHAHAHGHPHSVTSQ